MNLIKKTIAIFCSILIVVAVFNFALIFNIEEVSAANVDTCSLTEDGNYCVEVPSGTGFESYGGCKLPVHTNSFKADVPDCQKGVCAPSGSGGCLENVESIRCRNEQSGTFYQGATKESVSECSIGCCNLYSSCSVQESKVCTQDLGGSFISGITSRQECNLECAGSTLGCYISIGGGSCEYDTLDNLRNNPDFVSSNFKEGTECSEVVGCPTYRSIEKYKSCGDGTTDDDRWDVWLFDADGNREGENPVESCRPEGMCDDPDDIIGGVDASCISTNCVDDSPGTWPEKLKSGDSICMNVLSGHFSDDKRSTGLHNYILNCQNREITPDYDDDNRGKICQESVSDNSSRIEADFKDNKWEECHSDCGEGSAAIDLLNYAPGVGQFLANVVGSQCSDDDGWFNNQDECSKFGDCGGGPLMQDRGYDRDLWAPIGSCNPTYPPAKGAESYGDPNNRCSQCGKGGDGTVNVCTEFECNAMGDCQFEDDGFPTNSVFTTGALALGTMATVSSLCGLASIFGGVGGWAGCAAAAVGGFMPFASGGVLYWGVLSTIYGIAGAKSTQDTAYDSKDVYKDDKLRLSYILSWAKHLDKVLTDDGKKELIDSNIIEVGGGEYSSSNTLINVATTVLTATLAHDPGILPKIWSTQSEFSGKLIFGNKFLKISPSTWSTIFSVLGYGAMFYTTTTSFKTGKCVVEQPYTDSNHCGECGVEGQWGCSKDRCEILGAKGEWCEYVPYTKDGTVDGLCLPTDPTDHSSPYLTTIEAEFRDLENRTIQGPFNSQGRSLEISQDIAWDSDHVYLNINTSEISRNCKYSFARDSKFEDMTSFPYSASVDHDISISFSAEDKVRDKTYIYVKCKDVAGNINNEDRDYVSFSFAEAPDEVTPEIDYIAPLSVNVPEGTTDIGLTVYAYDKNGVSDCRLSKDNETLNFGDMESLGTKTNIQCTQTDETCQKYITNLDLKESNWCKEINDDGSETGIPSNSTFCPLWIKCSDTQNNIMENPFLWTLIVWPTFEMDVNKPNASYITYDDKFDIEIETENDALCKYQFNNDGWFNITTRYDKLHTSVHEDLLGTPGGMVYPLLFQCIDWAGNVVEIERTITAYRDVNPPLLLRVWTTNQQLHILMDEESECLYSTVHENFEFDEERDDVFSTIYTREKKEHYVSLGEDTYYIKCRDKWENENPSMFTVYP